MKDHTKEAELLAVLRDCQPRCEREHFANFQQGNYTNAPDCDCGAFAQYKVTINAIAQALEAAYQRGLDEGNAKVAALRAAIADGPFDPVGLLAAFDKTLAELNTPKGEALGLKE